MALEDITAGSTIATLDITNPAAGDDLSQGDDHIRNIKKALQYSFPNVSATVSGVASELAFAHKGGTVSGNMVVLGAISCSGAMSYATQFTGEGPATFNKTVSFTAAIIDGSSLVVGREVQHISATYSSSAALVGQIPNDGTTPQVTEGSQIASVVIKPQFTNSTLRFSLRGYAGSVADSIVGIGAVFRAAETDACAQFVIGLNQTFYCEADITASVTTTLTFALRVGPVTGSSNVKLNDTGFGSHYPVVFAVSEITR